MQKTMHFCSEDTFALQFIKLRLDFCRHQQLSNCCQNVSNIILPFIVNGTQGFKNIRTVGFFHIYPDFCVCACLHGCVGGVHKCKRKYNSCAYTDSFCSFPLQSLKKCLVLLATVQNLWMLPCYPWYICL